ncbi:MAG: response regulator transcription factor, partial [Nocardioides sp.]
MAGRTALVIEDDPDIRELIGETLSGADFTVHSAESGEGITELLARYQPELITLDIGLPGMDGVEVCKLIRESSQAYIIMLTARTDIDDRLVGLEAGADDYLSKPFSTRELRARADALFRRSRELVGVGEAGSDGRVSRPDISVGGGLVIL